MMENSILSQGYCMCTLQENLCFHGSKSRSEKADYPFRWSGQQKIRKRENPFCVDVTFLLVYTLLSKKEFYQWQKGINISAKQEWKRIYYHSEYNNTRYESFFDIPQVAEIDWVTGIFIKVHSGGVKEYWKILNAIAEIFKEEQRFVEYHESLRLEQILQRAWREHNEILQAGKLLIFLILAEFYQVHIAKEDWWNEVDRMILKGMLCYQGHSRICSKDRNWCQKLVNDSLQSNGIQPFRLKKYQISSKELPPYHIVQKEDWNCIWMTIIAMEKCIVENTKMYKKLKE